MSKSQPKLIIIDGNALIHRSFHALPPTLRTKKGQLVNAVYGFSSFLLKALHEFKPEYAVLTLDRPEATFRHQAYADYKATRTKAPDELYEQIPLVKKVAQAFNIPIFELAGYEADDLIGSICAQGENIKNLQKIIITGDLDTLQLINEQTKVYTMSRGLSDSILYGPEEVEKRYNLRPDQLIDYKALRGDPSDNIPGVRGIGEKMASELIGLFGTLDKVYQAAEKGSPKIKTRITQLLLAEKDQAYLSQELSQINREAPITFSLKETEIKSFSLNSVFQVFQELEFKSLLVKVKELRDKLNSNEEKNIQNKQNAKPDQIKIKATGALLSKSSSDQSMPIKNIKEKNNKSDYQLVNTPTKLAAFLKKIKLEKSFAISLTTAGEDPLSAKLLGLSFSWEKGQAYFIPAEKSALLALKPILADEKIKKIGHNLKFDWRVLKTQGLDLKGLSFDIMLASYLLNPASRQHDLSTLAFTELGLDIKKDNSKNNHPEQAAFSFDTPNLQELSSLSCEAANLTYRLAKILEIKIRESGLEKICQDIEMPLIPILAAMEQRGIKINPTILFKLEEETAAKLAALEKKIWKLAGKKFNINSTKQLKEILFEDLKIPTENIKKTKTGFSTAEDELFKLQDFHEIIPLLQEFRELSKLQNTYLQALPKMINPTSGRIHTSFNQTIAATGRLSSSDPNLQNIPVKTNEGQKVRSAFQAESTWLLVAFDYSQIELRLAAHMSKDKKMIAAFQAGQDIHTATAAAINGVSLQEVSPHMRREAKAVNFGILYGQGPHGLSQGAGIPYFAAQEFIKKYFLAYPGIKKMMDESIKRARQEGYIQTLFNRRRWLPDINSNIPGVRKSAERMAINTPIQGTAADIIKLAMIKVAQLIEEQEQDIKLLLQVHDELIFEVKEDKVNKYVSLIKDTMEKTVKLQVPVIIDVKSGKNWAELK